MKVSLEERMNASKIVVDDLKRHVEYLSDSARVNNTNNRVMADSYQYAINMVLDYYKMLI